MTRIVVRFFPWEGIAPGHDIRPLGSVPGDLDGAKKSLPVKQVMDVFVNFVRDPETDDKDFERWLSQQEEWSIWDGGTIYLYRGTLNIFSAVHDPGFVFFEGAIRDLRFVDVLGVFARLDNPRDDDVERLINARFAATML